MKKILLLILIISLIAIPISSCTPAPEPEKPNETISCSDGLEYKVGLKSYLVCLGSCDEENITVPTYDTNGRFIWGVDFVDENNKNIKSIRFMEGREVLYGKIKSSSLETIEFPENLKILGHGFLSYCTSLKSVTIPDNVVEISGLFNGCTALETVKLPKYLNTIGRATFANCKSLKEIDIPDSVIYIDDGAFMGCSAMKVIELPENVGYIGKEAFGNCIALEEIRVPMTIEEWNALEKHAEWSKDLLWPCKIVCTDGEIPHVEIK